MKEVGNAAKETDLTFKYKAKDPKKKIEKDSLPFQVIIIKLIIIKPEVKVFRIIPEFRISRLTFYRKSASKW